jgi:O-antigen biosynthesis protein
MAAPVRIPLSALRQRLDAESAATHWSLDIEGAPGRALVHPAECRVTFPLALGGSVSLHSQVRLVPKDWLDGTGQIRVTVAVVEADGARRKLWSRRLRAAVEEGEAGGVQLSCELPANAIALVLEVGRPRTGSSRAVGRVLWLDPYISDPHAGPIQPSRPKPTPARPADPQGNAPLISVLTPVHDPPLPMLEQAIASVQAQSFTDWELCLVDDGSMNPEIIEALDRHAAGDPRIRLTRHPQATGISNGTNAALALATGRYIALLDHDDTLAPNALQLIAETVARDPALDMIYSDEAVVSGGRQTARVFKPDWSPETMAALMYTCHVGVYRRSLALEVGGFNPAFDGCQDYDFVLRLAERTDRVGHIPEILYHWHAHTRSTAGGDAAKPYAYLAQPRAIAEHLERTGAPADVQFGPHPGMHRIVYRVDDGQAVELVVAVPSAEGLAEAARSWIPQPHHAWRLILAAPDDVLPSCLDVLRRAGVDDACVTAIAADPARDPAAALASLARNARAEHLVLMQRPVVGLTRDWLTRLVGYSCQPGIATAGPIVLTADGRIAEAGIVIPDGIPIPLLHGSEPAAAMAVAMNVSALSGCLITRLATLERLGGLRPEFGELALVDYGLRAAEHGLRNVIVPDARVSMSSPDYATNDIRGLGLLRACWPERLSGDPYYSPHYRPDRGDFRPCVAA